MVNFENLLATLQYKIRRFGQASDRASDTFGHCSVFSFSWKSLKMEPKKEPKDPQTIHEYLLLLLSTHQALKLKLWHVLKMSTKAHLGFEEALPFGQASDNLRTLFALFKMVSGNWEGRCSRGSLGEHMGVGVGVGVWGLTLGLSGFKLLRKLSFAQFGTKHCGVGSCRKLWRKLDGS